VQAGARGVDDAGGPMSDGGNGDAGSGNGNGNGGSDGGTGSGGSDSGTGSGGSDSGSNPGSNGVLTIAALTATVSTLTGGAPLATESNSATFTAIVTDSLGLDSLAGGQLLDDTGLTYAAFGTGAGKGTYVATITWSGIDQTRAITFVASGARTFIAKFFDNQGNTATASLQMNLACRDADGLVDSCGGVCTQLSTFYANCGTCGHVCKNDEACMGGTCASLAVLGTSACFAESTMNYNETCSDFCTAGGLTCAGVVTAASLANCTGSSGSGPYCSWPFTEFANEFLACKCE
jgi:hypothetical protein